MIAVLTLALTACPKRQTATRIVYVPAPPPVNPALSTGGNVMVIRQSPPPQPAVTQPKQREVPATASQRKPVPPTDNTTGNDNGKVARNTNEMPPANPRAELPRPSDIPQLESLSSVRQRSSLQREIVTLKDAVQIRINHLEHLKLSGADRKALDDARTYLLASDTASKEGDLQQSLNLAQKADLLVSSVEKDR